MLENYEKTSILELNQKIMKLEQAQKVFHEEIKLWKRAAVKDILRNTEMIKSIYIYLQLSWDAVEAVVDKDDSNHGDCGDFKPEIDDIIVLPEESLEEFKSSINFVKVQDNWKVNKNVDQELLCYYCGFTFQKARELEKHLREEHGDSTAQTDSSSISTCSVPILDILKNSTETCEISEIQCKFSNTVDIADDFGNITVDIEPESRSHISSGNSMNGESVQLSKVVQQQEKTMLLLLKLQNNLIKKPRKKKSTRRHFCVKNCGKSFKYRCHMMQHVDTNCGTIRNFECAICGRKFVKKSNMKLHILEIHFSREMQGEQPYECFDCGQIYRHRRDLVRHRKSKCGTVKNFECDMCGKRLSSKYHVREHIQNIHLFQDLLEPPVPRIRPTVATHTCHMCGRKYLHRRNLHRHLYSFCGTVKRFTCTLCNAKFTQKNALPRHMRNVHNIFSTETITTENSNLCYK